ncbi:MAG: right-handed parallel beta-helix repeat-containing protein [Bacteroidetes bacterium]|nr:right-handed parallel beta-helix repeat-containing protein [Bacteroidota bacterium]
MEFLLVKGADVVVTGTLIYRAGSGIAVKDSSIATIYNNTIYDCGYGIEVYEKNTGLGGGHAVAYNNIFWENQNGSFSLSTDATLELSYSNLQENIVDTVANNYSLDPFFVDASSDNFQLSPISPLREKELTEKISEQFSCRRNSCTDIGSDLRPSASFYEIQRRFND